MPRALALASLEGAGRLEPVRVAVRFAEAPATQGSGVGGLPNSQLAAAPLLPGRLRVGPFSLDAAIDAGGDAVVVDLAVRNAADRPVQLEAIVVGLRWTGHGLGSLRFLRHGWQSWSYAGARALDEAGEPPFPSGPWLRGMHHAVGEPPPDRAGWHESDLVTVVGGSPAGPACLAGVLERGRGFGVVYLRRGAEAVELELEVRLEVPLEPGERREAEPVRAALGWDASALLEAFAELQGERAGARVGSRFVAGWCSWYHFFHGITEEALRRNLEALAGAREELPIRVVQLDDGYQRAVGDWLETNEKFPSGLAALAAAIREVGFAPGLWTAPFCVAPESRLFAEHRDWLLGRDGELFAGLHHGAWSREGWIHVLDTSRDDVLRHLERLFAELAGMGFRYLKLDFLYPVAMRAEAWDPKRTRAERLRRGLEAIRAGAGPEAFLLGCGAPLGAAVGMVDAMRIGPDVADSWEPEASARIPGLEPTLPSLRNALRNILARSWMHRRLWLNDPDCLLASPAGRRLRSEEARTLAACIAATGGLTVFSDDVPALGPEGRALVREVAALARSVDAGARGPRALDLLGQEIPSGVVGRMGAGALVALVNGSDAPAVRRVDLAALGLSPAPATPEALLGTVKPEWTHGEGLRAELAPHATALARVGTSSRIAVFCDFDGTFAVQDVGATLARRHAGDRRPAVWKKLERGEITPWEHNLELLDRLPLPEADLDAFLRSIEFDPGARELLAWCAAREVPFRILSDGFDHNLERLQEIHALRFAFDANRLWYEGDAWRIAAAHPNPACDCGTGTCKRGRIEAFRAEHPGVLVVHIGNGRVSDLCAVQVADRVFAKDSLAEELRRRGLPFEPFGTLRDVRAALDRLVEGEGPRSA